MTTSAMRCGVEPWSWLRAVIERLSDGPPSAAALEGLLPDRWKAALASSHPK
ncbi:MAG TPA: transposase domain-containing protein [Gemmataceae bacterium]|nr:transposase domain-containing protein [Gemmataceae bacterium]